MTTAVWVKQLDDLNVSPSNNIAKWLTKPYILSDALKQVCQSLNVLVLSQAFGPIREDESDALKHDNHAGDVFIRQVFLREQETPLCYGRVVIPKPTYDAFFHEITKTGSQLLGENFLYKHPDMSRTPFQFAYIDRDEHLKNIHHYYPDYNIKPLFARRSVFYLSGYPLLVTEYFLPDIPPFPE